MYSLLFFNSLLFFSCISNQTVVYQASQEGSLLQTTWVVAETPEQIKISGQNRGHDIKLEYSPTFDLLHFLEKDSKTPAFEIHREGNNLSVKNNEKSKALKLGTLPWIQEFKFGFQPFLKSEDQEISFSIVYSKDNSLHDMTATKEKIEQLILGDKTYETQKLKITLKGFKKRFWKAEAWFDLKTNLMVKYKSNEGPGTAPIEVTLLL